MPTDPLSAVFSALADPTRRAILARLAAGEASVKTLAEPFAISAPAISRHLKVLERSGLIRRGRDARWRPCRLDPTGLRQAAGWLEGYRRYWQEGFDRLDDYLRELQTDKNQMNQTPTQITEKPNDLELVIHRVFDAPRHLVFAVWTRDEHLSRWCLPKGFTRVGSGGDLRPGGTWWSDMRSADGELFQSFGVYRDIVPDERLSFTHCWRDDDGKPEHETLITIRLAEVEGGKTQMTFQQAAFRSVASRDGHIGGWTETFDHLEKYLANRASV